VGKSSTCRILHHAISQQALCASYQECNTLDGINAQITNLTSEAFCIVEVASSVLPQANAMLRPHIAVAMDFATTPLLHLASTLAETAKRTAALFSEIEPGGKAIINRNSPYFEYLIEIAGDQTHFIISYGDHPDADGRLLDYQFEKQLVRASIFGEEIVYRLGMPGRHNAMNSLAALIALHALGLDWRKAASQFCALQALSGRGRHIQRRIDGKNIVLIDDAHEAKPMSMMAAFDVLAHMAPGPGGRRIAVLADMSELDSESPRCHAELAYPIIQAGIDRVYAAGELIEHLWSELPESIRGSKVSFAGELLPILRAEIVDGDVILFKGSKNTNLSEVLKGFHDLSPIVTNFQWQ
jgi:UDP-N-acetylmuramoyl-tripeptide--D-alanyl-D-alanine ligase